MSLHTSKGYIAFWSSVLIGALFLVVYIGCNQEEPLGDELTDLPVALSLYAAPGLVHDPSEVLGTYRDEGDDTFITFQLRVDEKHNARRFRIIYREGESARTHEPVMWNRLNTIKLVGHYRFQEVEINGRTYYEPVVLVDDLRSW